MILYLIRHAQSSNNALGDERNRVRDPQLTDLGVRQAEVLAQHLAAGIELEPFLYKIRDDLPRGYGINCLYCSPMWRSLQTAQFIGEALGLPTLVWTGIHEQGGIYLDAADGRSRVGYPGKTRQEIQAAFPDYVLPDDITEHGWWNGGYEAWDACHERARRVAEKLNDWAERDERIALITHGGFMDALLKALVGHLPGRQLFYSHYNTAITRLDFPGNDRVGIRYVNRIGHLPPGLVS